ncbi:MAG: asparaginase [bacterium]
MSETASPYRRWVRVERGGQPESWHDGVLVVLDDTGRVLARWGDPSVESFVRSSAKMVQAIPLVENGAADAFGFEPRHLALACASHDGEPFHVEGVRAMLARAGLDESFLHCGPHAPGHAESARDLVLAGEAPASVHNNCSGKHAGMLAAAKHAGHEPRTYWRPEHPLQGDIRSALAQLAELPPERIGHAVDGCGVPAWRLPVESFALALARFASGRGLPAGRRAATSRLFDAMRAHPEMVAGTRRICTAIMRATQLPLIAKGGAEGYYALAWRDGDRGFALASKSAAGDFRSSHCVVVEVLRQLGLVDAAGLASLARWHADPIRNHAGEAVGRLVPLVTL